MNTKNKQAETENNAANEIANKTAELSVVSHKNWPFDNGQFAPFHSLRREVDDLFNQFTGRFSGLLKTDTDALQLPALDVTESEAVYEITAEMPGVAEADIDVSVSENFLTIHGEKQQSSQSEDTDRRITECSYGVYERSLTLPFSCDAKSIKASYENGVLHLTIPKPEQKAIKPQKVAIKSAA